MRPINIKYLEPTYTLMLIPKLFMGIPKRFFHGTSTIEKAMGKKKIMTFAINQIQRSNDQMTNNFFSIELITFLYNTKLFVCARASVCHQNQLLKYNSKKVMTF